MKVNAGSEEDAPNIGRRIRAIRKEKGLSMQAIAARLDVDRTAIAKWEAGKHLPRDERRRELAATLGVPVGVLFGGAEPAPAMLASLVDTLNELEPLLLERLTAARASVKALRIAAPYATPAHVQKEFRQRIGDRILAGTIEVQRIEIVYGLDRLKELLSNILRYDGRSYWVKIYCAGVKEVVPGMGGYFFDDQHFLIGAYWTGIPPHDRPGLQLSGAPFETYFREYWSEIWRRGVLLNNRGAHDLDAVRDVAFALGLAADEWNRFVEGARALEIGDGCPPLI